jgi:hypothetical protein
MVEGGPLWEIKQAELGAPNRHQQVNCDEQQEPQSWASTRRPQQCSTGDV